jgi:dipeptidyl-peptidase-4
MTSTTRFSSTFRALLAGAAGIAILSAAVGAQDRLKTMPGYEQYLRMSKEIPGAVKMGNLSVTWKDGGTAFEYTKDGKAYRFDVATQAATELPASDASPMPPAGRGGLGAGMPERGRQVASADSPDKLLKAIYKNRNLYITDAAGGNETAVTTDGSEKDRIKYGSASWVYGEELAQTTATTSSSSSCTGSAWTARVTCG